MIAVLTQPEGDVTITDGLDVDHLIPSFPSLQKEVAALVDDLNGAVAGVSEIATHVTALASAAQDAADASEASAVNSAGAAESSEQSNQASLQHATDANASAVAADASRSASATTASASAASAAESAESASRAFADANRSAAEADDSAASASAALVTLGESNDARDLAEAWATNPENVEVSSGGFSAMHWALKAQQFATGSLVYLGSWDASGATLPPNAKKGAFYKISGQGTVKGVTYRVGDNIVHNGTDWDLIDNTETVTAVAGKVGNVALVTADIAGLDTALASKASINHQHAIADVVNLQTTLDSKVPRAMETTLGDKISLYGDRFGQTSFHGFGVEDSTTYYKSGALHRWYTATNADGVSWTAQLSSGGVTVKGVIQAYRGAVGTQQICFTMGWSNLAQRINHVIEGDGSYSVYTYDSNGGAPSLDMRMSRGGAVTYSSGIASGGGGVTTRGPSSAFWFEDRVTKQLWALYGNGGTAAIWNGNGDVFRIGNDGTTIANGWVYAPNFKIQSDLSLKTEIERLNGREQLENIRRLMPLFYRKHGQPEYGFGAQHVLDVYPTMVGKGPYEQGTLTLSVAELIAPIVASIQELDRRLTVAGL